MPCIVLKDPDGVERKITITQQEGHSTTTYTLKPGEKAVRVEANCPEGVVSNKPAVNKQKELLHELDKEIGSGSGDWIKRFATPIAKMMGRKSCTGCEARRIVTNAYAKLKAKHGQVEALRHIKELWKLSFEQPVPVVMEKLKVYLND